GLRNGLRNPRPLPDFTNQPTTQPAGHSARREPGGEARALTRAQAAPSARPQDASPPAKAAQPEDTRSVPSIMHGGTRFAVRDEAAGEHVTLSRAEATGNLPACTHTPGEDTPVRGRREREARETAD